jgi:cytochrome c-type biogenesis protein CcmH/NrfF
VALFVCAALAIVPTWLPREAIGQAHVDKGGTVGIENETQRELFFSLICACGCPRETLGTCTCTYGNARRDELRDMLAQGLSIQAIQDAYGKRFGSEFLALPPNKGASRLIWALPLVAFIGGAVLVVALLRSWTRRGRASARTADAKSADENPDRTRDAYDDKLDEQLKELDRE